MTARERFRSVLDFQKPDDRLPMVEWAPWWDVTLDRWHGEGLDPHLWGEELVGRFGLDSMVCLTADPHSRRLPTYHSHGPGLVTDEESYERILPFLFQEESIQTLLDGARALKAQHDRGEVILRIWLDGFFWFPRTLFGIEPHLFAFHDQPDLMHRMNADLADFHVRTLEALSTVLLPDMIGYAEDMSYNLGPMLSKELFDTFLLPYYRKVNAFAKRLGHRILIDSDGDVTTMVPWLIEAGIEGVYPLERQAGVDVALIRERHPRFLMLGGYDKMVMSRGEEAMRAEFERLLPVMRSGGYVPSVDHQTPPGVSLEAYRIYLALFREYSERAAR
jgi:uroporphyrinogen-III decarboxylase